MAKEALRKGLGRPGVWRVEAGGLCAIHGDLVAEDTQARQHVARPGIGKLDKRLGAWLFGLGRPEHVFIGLQLELKRLVTLLQ